MGELKPIGSEKLDADAKLKRILELTYYNNSKNSIKSAEMIAESSTGVYGIVKEKDGFYVKKGLNENSLDYIGGLFMKNKNKFSSYGEAFKKLEFLIEQEKVQEATKFVLKTPKPQQEAPIPQPTDDLPPAPAAPEGEVPAAPESGEELPPEGEVAPDNEEDYLEAIQSAAGKLQQKLRKYEEKLKSEDIKGAIMQVLSAIDLEKKLEDKDKDEIIDKFDPEDGEEMSPEDSEIPSDTDNTTPPENDELGENDGMAALEELITHPFEDDFMSGDETYDDDESDLDPVNFEDKKAEKFARQDIEKEFSNDDDEDFEGTTDEYVPDEEETDEEFMPTSVPETPEPESLPSEPIPSNEAGDVKEFDINELTDMINTGVKETLSKYFEQ